MKNTFVYTMLLLAVVLVSCEKEGRGSIPDSMPRTSVPVELRGAWMYGQFSMTEYWSQNPSSYLGNALSTAIAFRFYENGTYEQYFTASTINGGSNAYQQSVTRGTVEIDPLNRIIKTHPYQSRYKRTRGELVEEDRNMKQSELQGAIYTFTTGIEPSGSKAVYLQLQGTANAIPFISKP